MSKSQRLFRYVWRINGVLILLAAVIIILTVGGFLLQDLWRAARRRQDADVRLSMPDTRPNARLSLGRASLVRGTNVMRAELKGESGSGKYSSGYDSETRNILFIEPGNRKGRWLLPDNNHFIADSNDFTDEKNPDEKRVIATAALVVPRDKPDNTGGRLILFDATGKNLVEIASDVREIHITSAGANELTILFERDNRLVLATFDPRTHAKLREQEVEVPGLNER
jgi:hypothetical protein